MSFHRLRSVYLFSGFVTASFFCHVTMGCCVASSLLWSHLFGLGQLEVRPDSELLGLLTSASSPGPPRASGRPEANHKGKLGSQFTLGMDAMVWVQHTFVSFCAHTQPYILQQFFSLAVMCLLSGPPNPGTVSLLKLVTSFKSLLKTNFQLTLIKITTFCWPGSTMLVQAPH